VTYFVMQFADDAGNEPIGVWYRFAGGKCAMNRGGLDHRSIVTFKDEDEAWRVVERNHPHGELWGVISSEMLARKLRTGRYGP
jgi:hypothetical protein